MIKNWQKKALKCLIVSTLDKNTMDWISVSDLYSLRALYPFSYTIYLNCLIIKARLMKYFFHSFAKKKNPFGYASYVHSFEILNLDGLSLFNQSPTNSCVFPWKYVVLRFAAILQTAREMTCTSQKQREDIFDLLHLLLLWQNCFKQFPTHVPEGLDLSRVLPVGDGNKSNWTSMHNYENLGKEVA